MWLLSPVLPFASSGLKPRVAEYDCAGFVWHKATKPKRAVEAGTQPLICLPRPGPYLSTVSTRGGVYLCNSHRGTVGGQRQPA